MEQQTAACSHTHWIELGGWFGGGGGWGGGGGGVWCVQEIAKCMPQRSKIMVQIAFQISLFCCKHSAISY